MFVCCSNMLISNKGVGALADYPSSFWPLGLSYSTMPEKNGKNLGKIEEQFDLLDEIWENFETFGEHFGNLGKNRFI